MSKLAGRETAAPPELAAESVSKSFGSKSLFSRRAATMAVDNVSVRLRRGDFVAIVGESGSGKSTLARMLMGLVSPTSGRVSFDGVGLEDMSAAEMRSYRSRVQCVLQDPSGSLNPRKTVATSLIEVLRLHGLAGSKAEARSLAQSALTDVGVTPAARFLDRYPHELSGGQRQRVLIARAIMLRPEFIIADEAVSALDVAVKAGIIDLLLELQEETGVGFAFITHDLQVVRPAASAVVVMRQGRIVESGSAEQIFEDPHHEYTRELVAADPDLDSVLAERGWA